MAKRKADDDLLSGQPWKQTKDEDEEQGERLKTFKQNHTLDSDEEDDAKPAQKYHLKEDDVEGAEDTDRNFDEGIKFTPFNLKEEMEEGHFDAEGNYYENKEDLIQDNWLENIDWVRVKESDIKEDAIIDDDEVDKNRRPENDVFQDILQFMKPGESITKAIQRLGGGKKQRKGTQRKRKNSKEADKDASNGTEESEKMAKDKEDLVKLTELTDDILCRGNYEVYQYTYEKIQHTLKQEEEKRKKKEEDAFDMFAEEVEDKKLNTASTVEGDSKSNAWDPDGIHWEYKWENSDDAKIYGPYSSEQMQDWKDQDFFKDGCFVRKVGSKDFYAVKRIDFDLYT